MAISDRITSIEEHIKESYQELEGIGIDTTGVNNNLENIPKLIDGYWETLPKVTGEGTSITLDNTKEGKMKIVLKGNTSQNTTTGKNLLENSLARMKTDNTTGTWNNNAYTLNGIVFTPVYENDMLQYINVNGTATSQTDFIIGLVPLINGTTYTGTGCPSGGSTTTYRIFYSYIGGDYGTGVTLTATTTTSSLATARVYSGATVNNLKFYPMVRLSNITDDTYEPYTNGASPNPDYPQDIHVVSGDNSIVVCGKNFFNANAIGNTNISVSDNGSTIILPTSSAGGNAVSLAKTLRQLAPNLKVGETYKVLFNSTSTKNYIYASEIWGNSTSKTITENMLNASVYFYGESNTTTTITNMMIIKSSTNDTTYEAYKGASYPISLGVENLFNQQDFITAMSTHYREIKTIDGVEYICLGRSQTTTTTYTYSLNCKENTQYALSFKYISSSCSLRVVYSDGTDSGSLTPDKATLTDVSFTSASNKTITGISLYCGGWYASGNKLEIGEIGLTEGTTLQHISTTPIELCKIGTYQDKIDKSTGKNLFNKDSQDILENVRIGADGGNNADSGYFISEFIEITPNTKYTKNTTADAYHRFAFYTNKSTNSFISKSEDNTITTPSNAKYLRICGLITEKGSIMLNEGSTALPYEPYGTSWYLKKEIGKVVLDGSESWTTNSGWHYTNTNIYILNQNPKTTEQVYSDKFFFYRSAYANDINGEVGIVWGSTLSFRISKTLASDTEAFKTWLSTHNTIVYYVLATPTYTEITDSTLLSQLNALAKSYASQTNISQESNDLASILNATALKEM